MEAVREVGGGRTLGVGMTEIGCFGGEGDLELDEL